MSQKSKAKASPGKAAAKPSGTAGLNDRWPVLGVCLFLTTIVWVVFGQTLRHGFVNFDDDDYVYENPVVQKGLTWEGFRWALTYGKIGHWHPLTWLSHMLDCQIYGLHAGGHHFTNVLLHTLAVIFLFLVLRRMTGFLWRSALVAAVFAIHPLRAESVAWVAERKDVLSALFFMLTIGAYVRYVNRPRSILRYGSVLLLFALGLLSKNMLVTLPFVLLLLDYWPLKRFPSFAPRVWLGLTVEKIPLFVLAAASCVMTALSPEKVAVVEKLSFGLRMENAVVSYVTYLWQMIDPTGLACLYPNPVNPLPFWQVTGALGLLLAISVVAFAFRRTRPYLVVGWFWYLGMMIPVIGVVQISYYAHADRYTYLPQIGLYLMLAWAAADWSAGWRHRRLVRGGLSTLILAALMYGAWVQTAYWRNSESLWTHALACTSDNAIAENNLGNALLQMGRVDEAIGHYQKALRIKPDYVEANNNLYNALLTKGNVNEAIAHYQQALQINPDDAKAHLNLGNALLQKGSVDEAISHYQRALQINLAYWEAHFNLGNALLQKGNVDEAISQYQQALQINPDSADVRSNLGNALLKKGNVDEAIAQYQKALEIKPDYAEAHNNLGYALFLKGRADDAIAHYQTALQIRPGYAEAHYNLGYALLQKGDVTEAVAHYQQALEIKPDYADAHLNLGNALLQMGNVAEAIAHYQKALQIKPDYLEVQNNLAWLLATAPQASLRNGRQAVELAQRAKQLAGGENLIILHTLAAAYAEAGRFDDARQSIGKALELARAAGRQDMVKQLNVELKLYEAGLPFHLENK